MTDLVLIPGAFRGAWSWDLVRRELVDVPSVAVDLPSGDVSMVDWIEVVAAVAGESSILVGHSMGGVVAQAAAASIGVRSIALVDAPVLASGQCALDASGPAPPTLPDRATQIPATPVGEHNGFSDPDLVAWVNSRLAPTPFGPTLDPIVVDPGVAVHAAFCSRTPDHFPAVATRRRFDAAGMRYSLIDCHHDAPLLAPRAVADFLRGVVAQSRI